MKERNELVNRVEQTIRERGLVQSASCVLLMVSGGSDSTALAYVAAELRSRGVVGQLAMLHVNHMIRGEASDADQAFVQGLASALDIPLTVCAVDIPGKVAQTGGNLEATARKERYHAAFDALESLCEQAGCPQEAGRIFTAHTQDDRVENFYMRSIVGTGPGGFRSMRYANGLVTRPLLDVSRESLRGFIQSREAQGQAVAKDRAGALWREDATNAHIDRFRAFVRHEIIPLTKQRNPQLLDTLCRTMNLIADEDDLLDEEAGQLEHDLVTWLQPTASPDAGTPAIGCLDTATASQALGAQCPDQFAGSPGCLIAPPFAQVPLALRRRVALRVLQSLLGEDARIETATVEAVLAGFSGEGPVSGYTANIQGDLALSANKRGLLIEPMASYRARRKKKN